MLRVNTGFRSCIAVTQQATMLATRRLLLVRCLRTSPCVVNKYLHVGHVDCTRLAGLCHAPHQTEGTQAPLHALCRPERAGGKQLLGEALQDGAQPESLIRRYGSACFGMFANGSGLRFEGQRCRGEVLRLVDVVHGC